ncbi:MAG TPA: lamin tail domain-containing protein [Candidatus Saccharibacteria bacterium]|nr:lamin tail domain-containing protein [Candidatus Saccharibacteria bacterium]
MLKLAKLCSARSNMVYRHKVGLTKSLNQKITTFFATLLVLMSPVFSAGSILAPAKTNATAVTSHVVINEIVANPATGEIEWVELYNPTNTAVDMSDWRIRQTSGNFSGVFASGTTIDPYGYLIREKTTSISLVNSGATLQLETTTNATDVDTVTYPSLGSGESYARQYDASTIFEIRSNPNTTKGASNGTAPAPPAAAPQVNQIVKQSDLANTMTTWTYQNDNTNVANPSGNENHEIIANPQPSIGNWGAARLNAADTSQRWNLASLQYSGTKLTDIAALGFDVYTDSPGKAYINLDVDFNHAGLTGWQGRLVYIPVGNTANNWSTQEAVASNSSWQWSRMVTGAFTQWPDGNTSESRTWNDIIEAFPEARITAVDNAAFGSLYLRTDGISTTFYDNVYLATSSENFKYNFELAFSGGTSQFLGSPKYVRTDNAGDLSGAVRVPGAADAVRFNFTGTNTLPHIAGYEHLQTAQWPNAQGDKQFRVTTALPAGLYNLTAEYRVYGVWYPVTGDADVYSIDSPWAVYATPSLTNNIFRTSDNPIRVRVDDQFNQFKHLISEVNGNKFAVLRDQCDLRQAGNYLLCDVKEAIEQTISGTTYPAWIPLAEGTYTAKTTTFTKANNRKDDIVSLPFTIDATRPVLTNFAITTPEPIYGDAIEVTADATDSNGIEYVKFYISEPRVLDGQCDGNGTQQRIEISNTSSGSTYSATFDTSGLNGEYCLNALAKDNSSHTSSPILRIKVTIDTTVALEEEQPAIVITPPPTQPQQSGTTTTPVTTFFQNFVPAFINDGVVTPVPTTETPVTEVADNADGEVLGAQDTFANEAANFAGANTKSGISKGLLWLLIASGAIGTIIAWFLLARRRQGTE